MSSRDIVAKTLGHTTFRINKAFEGLSEEEMDMRPTPQAKTPREILEHLSECYTAYLAMCEGREHEWGNFQAPERSTFALKQLWTDLREKAVAKAANSDDEKHLQNALDYIALHDEYHVGQICLLRMQCEPEWDPYSIYQD